MPQTPPKITQDFLLQRYEVLLIDAFGVLMDSEGALPGAISFIDQLNQSHKPYIILSNSALYNSVQNEVNYRNRGLRIPKENILTSGMLMPMWIHQQNLSGGQFLVLGPEPTKNLIRDGGGVIASDDATDVDAIVLGHQSGFDFVTGMDHVITLVFKSIENGKPIPVLVPNPDVIYPKVTGEYGITGGSLAILLEEALRLRYPSSTYPLTYLGKPHSPLFEEASRRTKTRNMVMIGDQLDTDIKGASHFGIDSVLIGTGVTKIENVSSTQKIIPTYFMEKFTTDSLHT